MEKNRLKPVVIVIGGGPAGLMAAGTAACSGARTILFEKNPQCGAKLLLSGSGKCNITNHAPLEQFLDNYPENRKFLYPAFKKFFREELESFFNERHVFFRTEENGKIFPSTKSAESVLDALLAFCHENEVEFHLGEPVLSLRQQRASQSEHWVVKTVLRDYAAKSVIVATGGLSYPNTGSTGDGYAFARACSHTVVPTRPALVALVTTDPWSMPLCGISLRNVRVSLLKKTNGCDFCRIAVAQGDLLFTHFGLSGPPVLFLSRWLPDRFEEQSDLHSFFLDVDLFPALTLEETEQSLLRGFASAPARQLKTILNKEMGIPLAVAGAFAGHLGFREDITGQEITKEKRKRLLASLKALRFPLSRTKGYQEAMVTAGGISTKEIHPQTMESTLASHLYFAGELIDIDGYTGGFNLQAAFSTGYIAGICAAQ